MKIDVCITTMNRPQAVERLLFSIAEHRPEAPVHVADQSETIEPGRYERLAERLLEAGLHEPPTVHRLPFDCGASYARNHLVDASPGEYKLIADDDGLFTAETDVEAMARLLDALPQVGIVGGTVARGGTVANVGSRLLRRGEALYELEASQPYVEHEGIRFRQVDFLPNFALMRRQLFEHLRWDPELKIGGEHLDFYLELPRTPYTAVLTPDATGEHVPLRAGRDYWRLRMRGDFFKAMMIKHGLTRVVQRGDTVSELHPGGRLTRVRQPGAAALAERVPELG